MNESIYNLIPKHYVPPAKATHRSNLKSSVKVNGESTKFPRKTMGPAKVETRAPDDFLKKHEKEPQMGEKKPFTYPDTDSRRPPIPRKDDRPIMGIKTTKDFIKQNAVENIMSVPKKPAKNFVDTKKGDKQPLQPSGLEPVYVHKKDFGETPKYIKLREEEIRKAQEEYNAYLVDRYQRGAMKKMTEDERQAILSGLKSNWEYMHHEYQGLSVVTDTAPKKHRKERMEAEMKQLERDIETIEKHRTIYIANN